MLGNKLFVLIVATLLIFSTFTEAAFKTARWTRPTAFSEQGDRRYLMQKYQKQIVKDAREEDPLPPQIPYRRKSRSYHFAYGPIYPNYHAGLRKQAENWYPLDHQLYY